MYLSSKEYSFIKNLKKIHRIFNLKLFFLGGGGSIIEIFLLIAMRKIASQNSLWSSGQISLQIEKNTLVFNSFLVSSNIDFCINFLIEF